MNRLYPWVFRTFLVRLDPETAHHLAFWFIRAIGKTPAALKKRWIPNRQLRTEALGLTFPSPFGLAAGFDKDAKGIAGLGALGFGHVEVGTLTAHPQDGNPRPRLFRLLRDRGVINRMGFNNNGAAAAVSRIENARLRKNRPIIGVNIGKSRVTPVEQAVEDYLASTRMLAPVADYLVVNVSSPNTPGLRGLQEIQSLEPLLAAVQEAAGSTPVLVKIAPDMENGQIDEIVDLVRRLEMAGIIATNTTVQRDSLSESPERIGDIGAGGLSGAPLAARSLEVLRRIRARAPEDLCIISVGGVTTAGDVRERLEAGATLVQGYTAFLYEGPFWARRINRGLATNLNRRQFT